MLYETTVAAGPFRIQDLNDAVSGELNVRVEEQDGSVQEFTMNTASIPYLTRPGSLRYKLALGKPSDIEHRYRGPCSVPASFPGGEQRLVAVRRRIAGGDYNAAALGIGRDLMLLGLCRSMPPSRAPNCRIAVKY